MKIRVVIEADFDHERMMAYRSYREGIQGAAFVGQFLRRDDNGRDALRDRVGSLAVTDISVEKKPE